MDKHQAETAAEALLEPLRAQQEHAATEHQLREERKSLHQRRSLFAILGCALGSLIEYATVGHASRGFWTGLLLGYLIGLLLNRKARPST